MTVWTEFVCFLVAAVLLVPSMSIMGLVWARGAGALCGAVAAACFARYYCELRLRTLVLALARPALGAACMFVLVHWVSSLMDALWLKLVTGVLCGAGFYITWCWVSWRLIGRPDGLESMVLGQLKQYAGQRGRAAR